MILDEEDVIKHYGKKGMKWGNRRARDKTKIIGAGVAGYELTNVALGTIGKKIAPVGATPVGLLLQMGLSATVATAAAKATANILDKKGNVKVPKKSKSTN